MTPGDGTNLAPSARGGTGADVWFEREAVKWLRARGYVPLTAAEAEELREAALDAYMIAGERANTLHALVAALLCGPTPKEPA